MHRKCTTHVTELYDVFQATLKALSDKIQTQYTIQLANPRRTLPKINKQSSSESKIKFYRRLKNITQVELAKQLGVTRDVIMNIENGARNGKNLFYDRDIINQIIDILDMRDKFGKSDTYIRFLAEDGNKQLKEFRIKNNLSVKTFANMMGVDRSTIRRWENYVNTISIDNYLRYKKIRDSLLVRKWISVCAL